MKKINWIRVGVLVSLGMNLISFYGLFKLHDVVLAFGNSLVYYSEVLSFVFHLREL